MKKDDFTKRIMDQVVGYERKRSLFWLLKLSLFLFVVFAVGGFFLWSTISELVQQRSFDLLGLFGEEFEVIKEYWKDTLLTFIEEIPPEKIILAIAFILIAIVILVKFRKKIKLVLTKLKNIAKY